MANELRKIVFNLTEIQAALYIFKEKVGVDLPSAALSEVKEEAGGRLIFTFQNGKTLAMRDRDMVTALLVFCQQKNIMVPKKGKKVLRVEAKVLTMLIKI
ncbi:hypothetical protein MTBPR1_100103 [Candidatus Terasakiella magnetica]|uniref:Uncharacterized protein n=1 Tax=Candidatus Terasakiella magnetica TaxID=1867952 RepID=A0A1C3RDZ9_9PROT|nr:hypothetical protein [Candidatus Terasakiella magnetica]SCA55462.1 hypothetical protein MTBPR1_100103 [Candidatus Terasakiella magnetica]